MSTKPWRIGDAGTAVFEADKPKYIASNLSHEDARLIAYAPAMLQVLENVKLYFDCEGKNFDNVTTILEKVKGGATYEGHFVLRKAGN